MTVDGELDEVKERDDLVCESCRNECCYVLFRLVEIICNRTFSSSSVLRENIWEFTAKMFRRISWD